MSAIPEQTTEQGPIQLAWDGPKVVVAPDDQKRIVQQSSWSGMAYPIDLANQPCIGDPKNMIEAELFETREPVEMRQAFVRNVGAVQHEFFEARQSFELG